MSKVKPKTVPEYEVKFYSDDQQRVIDRSGPMKSIRIYLNLYTGEDSIFGRDSIPIYPTKIVVKPDEHSSNLDVIPSEKLRVMPLVPERFLPDDWYLVDLTEDSVVFKKLTDEDEISDVPHWLRKDELKSALRVNGNQANSIIDAFRDCESLIRCLHSSSDSLRDKEGIGPRTAKRITVSRVKAMREHSSLR